MWEVEFTNEFDQWWETQSKAQQEALDAAIPVLQERGPALGEPLVKRIKNSRHKNMKELRVSKGGVLRALFAFDPRRIAILLLGGDKEGQWKTWYEWAVPEADRLYDEHLAELKVEELI